MAKYKIYIQGGGECYIEAENENEALVKARKNCPNVTNRIMKLKED